MYTVNRNIIVSRVAIIVSKQPGKAHSGVVDDGGGDVVDGLAIDIFGAWDRVSNAGQDETTGDLAGNEEGSTLVSAVRILLVDSRVVALRILAAFEHGRNQRLQLAPSVSRVVDVTGAL